MIKRIYRAIYVINVTARREGEGRREEGERYLLAGTHTVLRSRVYLSAPLSYNSGLYIHTSSETSWEGSQTSLSSADRF